MPLTIITEKELVLLQYITGFDEEQFNELYRRIKEIFASRPPKKGGLEQALSLYDQLAARLMLLRHNVTEEMVAQVFGVTQSVMWLFAFQGVSRGRNPPVSRSGRVT